MRKRIYLAGAYSADNVLQVLHNIRLGISVASKFTKQGLAVFCPFLDYQYSFFHDLTIQDYYEYSLAFLAVCDEIWVLPHYEKSKGTLQELQFAKERNIPIKFLTEEDL